MDTIALLVYVIIVLIGRLVYLELKSLLKKLNIDKDESDS